ncbi:hypothetical protein [Halalkalicoccus ordinarius]|uniref:hypothetical protein n=1 Tax=Halalkalicoccus ordinarius TaxID=3116651 RepID=UPI00300E9732
MRRESAAKGVLPDRLPFLVSALGVLVAVLPVAYLPSSSGALAFVMLVAKGIAVTTGLGVVVVGLYSYRTGDSRPAAVAGSVVGGLVVVGVVGGLVESASGRFVPIWVWFSSVVLVVGATPILIYRFVDGPSR